MLGVQISRDAEIVLYPFTEYFKGFDEVEAVREIFHEETERVLKNLKIEFYSSRRGYMSVSDEDGHVLVNSNYLRNGNERDLYLDIIHELVHVRQFLDGEKLFDERWEYVDRPTEIEAYQHAVKEARRIGMSDEEVYKYLSSERRTEEEVQKLAKSVGVNTPFPEQAPVGCKQ